MLNQVTDGFLRASFLKEINIKTKFMYSLTPQILNKNLKNLKNYYVGSETEQV